MILYGTPIAEKLLLETKNKIKKNNLNLTLAILENEEDEASKVYIKNKVKACELCGINTEVITFNSNNSTKDYLEKIKILNNNDKITGIIAQLPLPKNIDAVSVVKAIAPEKDVDGFSKLSTFPPCTPSGIISMIDYYKSEDFYSGKNAVVIGRSKIVGRPLAQLLTDRDCTVTLCHSKTKNIEYYTQNADIVVVAVGKANFLQPNMVKPGTIIIDVGINKVNGKICGDCITDKFAYECDISPVPKGVGATTVATLVSRLPELYNLQKNKKKNIILEK